MGLIEGITSVAFAVRMNVLSATGPVEKALQKAADASLVEPRATMT